MASQVKRDVLPIPDQAHTGLVTYDAKDPDTSFPPIEPLRPPEGAPNVLVVLLDDVGFGASSAFGGPCSTPTAERLADNGLKYNRFHTTALCSPTRQALLTGRNHHSVGMGGITEIATSAPGYNSIRPNTAAPLAETLKLNGYSTAQFGKCHEVPVWETSPLGPFDAWPAGGGGFEHFYGFIGGETNQYAPAIYDGTVPVEPDRSPEEGYHFTEDMTDRAIAWIRQQKALMPDKPFFAYFAPGATHAPHHVPTEWSDKYKGRFDHGWDALREETFARQKELGVIPPEAELTDRPEEIPGWDDMPDDLKPVLARQMEVYAGFLEHTDHHIGRFIATLERYGILDDTLFLVMSDNGASGEGTQLGVRHQVTYFNGVAETFDEKMEAIDDWAGERHCTNYAVGWAMAGNTPNRWYKRLTHEGGTRSPLIVHWPRRVRDAGGIRSQFHHVTDVVPTILDTVGIQMPDRVRGYEQKPLEGTSFSYTFDQPDAPTTKHVQYFEMLGHRAIWVDGWKAVTAHMSTEAQNLLCDGVITTPQDGDFDGDQWELYHLDEDFSEARDLSDDRPELLTRLVDEWWKEAEKHQVLPLDDRYLGRYRENRRSSVGDRDEYIYYGPIALTTNGSPNVKGISHTIEADVTIGLDGSAHTDGRASVDGAIISDGGPTGGYVLGIVDGRVSYASNYLGRDVRSISLPDRVTSGRLTINVAFVVDGNGDDSTLNGGTVYLSVDGGEPVIMDVPRTNPTRYDLTGEGLRVGQDISGVWSLLAPPAVFQGTIHHVRIIKHAASREYPELAARSAFAEQ
jgi:arylsulfatase A-like enzyme